MAFLAIRGAITCDENTKADITEKTQELVKEILERNSLDSNDIVSMLFTATSDLTQEFPATAARALGLDNVPLMCAQELEIEGSMQRCVRVMIHVDINKKRSEIHHVFLGAAQSLRKDLEGK
jgi:chorismate mutase